LGLGMLYEALPLRAKIQIGLRISQYVTDIVSEIIETGKGIRDSWRGWVKIHEKVKRETAADKTAPRRALVYYSIIDRYAKARSQHFYVIKIR